MVILLPRGRQKAVLVCRRAVAILIGTTLGLSGLALQPGWHYASLLTRIPLLYKQR